MYPFLMCALAGLSTGLGAVAVIAGGGISREKMSFYQGFAGGVMLTVSICDLLVEGYKKYISVYTAGQCLQRLVVLFLCGWAVGMAAASLCDTLRPPERENDVQTAYKMAVLTTFIMVLHNLPEGMLTIFTSAHSAQLGAKVTAAVALHNIPEGMAIAGPVLYASGSKWRAFWQSLLAGMSELAGGALTYFILGRYVNQWFISSFMPIIAGVMCQTAAMQLIPAAVRLSNIKHTIHGIIAGVVVMLTGIFAF